MRTLGYALLITLLLVLPSAAQSGFDQQQLRFSDTALEEGLFGIPGAGDWLEQYQGEEVQILDRSETIDALCQSETDWPAAVVLSERMTRDEADDCYARVTERFDRYRGYVYFNLDRDTPMVLDQYRFWTDPNLTAEDQTLVEFLSEDDRLIPQVLEKTNAPETCTGQSRLACADGTYCCNGTCIDEGEECD